MDLGDRLSEPCEMSSRENPPPHYSLFDTSRGDDPAVVVVNSALRRFDDQPEFPWHLELTIECKLLGARGMPTSEEIGVLEHLEDAISAPLTANANAMFLSRVTCRGLRELTYRVHDPEVANDILSQFIDTGEALREWDYRMVHDAAWDLAQPVFGLFGRDPEMN